MASERSLGLQVGETPGLDPRSPIQLRHLRVVIRAVTEAIAEDFERKLSVLKGRIAELENSLPVYRGVFEANREYRKNELVTAHGGLWICLSQTRSAPPSPDWQLAVKQGPSGRPGRDGKDMR